MAGSLALALLGMAETLAISVPTVVDGVTGRTTLARIDARLERWSRRLLAQAAVELRVVGKEHLDGRTGETFIVMSNHQSHYDIPTLFQALSGRHLRMITKTELFRVPIWGRAMREAGFLQIDRKNRERAIETLKVAKEVLAGGVDVWIAPEGTRSRTGKLGDFKKGGFVLAQETGVRILPVAIVGTRAILGADAAHVHKGAKVTVKLGAPIDPAGFPEDRRDDLVAAVRAAIVAMLGDG